MRDPLGHYCVLRIPYEPASVSTQYEIRNKYPSFDIRHPLPLSAPSVLSPIDSTTTGMIDCRQLMKGTGAQGIMANFSTIDVMLHKAAGSPKFALSDCACCLV